MSSTTHTTYKRKSLREVLIENQGHTPEEADKRISQARRDITERIESGELPFDFCEEEFGLEPDYLDDLLI